MFWFYHTCAQAQDGEQRALYRQGRQRGCAWPARLPPAPAPCEVILQCRCAAPRRSLSLRLADCSVPRVHRQEGQKQLKTRDMHFKVALGKRRNKDNPHFCSVKFVCFPKCCGAEAKCLGPSDSIDRRVRESLQGRVLRRDGAGLIAPVSAKVSGLAVNVSTEYPFGDTVTLTLSGHGEHTAKELRLRIPDWADHATVKARVAFARAKFRHFFS